MSNENITKGDNSGVSTIIPYHNKPALIAYYLGVFASLVRRYFVSRQ